MKPLPAVMFPMFCIGEAAPCDGAVADICCCVLMSRVTDFLVPMPGFVSLRLQIASFSLSALLFSLLLRALVTFLNL